MVGQRKRSPPYGMAGDVVWATSAIAFGRWRLIGDRSRSRGYNANTGLLRNGNRSIFFTKIS